MKRLLDLSVSAAALLMLSPVLAVFLFLVWLQDRHSPFYVAARAGRGGKPFRMVKMRSMAIHADKTGVASTSTTDRRITKLGHTIRRYKLDELTQLWNVLTGDMSLVGPRPQIERAVRFYTSAEKELLSVQPGITDVSSIVFWDEGDILEGHDDADLAYEQLIRPWKSRLSLFYIKRQSVLRDIELCWLTAVSILSRPRALRGIQALLMRLGAERELVEVAGRSKPLEPTPPPGADRVVTSRDGNVAA
jgi:lipopolysaccharide/colanic/teichoic acid biosynthesis glycosyltransferase